MGSMARCMIAVAAGAACLGAAEGPVQYLANGSFEEGGAVPRHWSVFVMPMDGATGTVDLETAAEGSRSVRLHIPKPYPADPANNWSQNILKPLGGKSIDVAGQIRTENAGQAGILVQCWQQSPWRMLKSAYSYDEQPVDGTQDWTPVAFTVDVPKDTSFVTVRCLLRGEGTAWFDALSVVERVEPPAAAADRTAPPPPNSPMTRPSLPPDIEQAQQALEASKDAVAAEISALEREIRALRGQLDALRDERAAPRVPEPAAEPPVPAAKPEPVPPLVPVYPEDEVTGP